VRIINKRLAALLSYSRYSCDFKNFVMPAIVLAHITKVKIKNRYHLSIHVRDTVFHTRSRAMSVINFITAMQPSSSLTGKESTVQTVAAAQPQPTTNTSSVTISSDAMRRANYEQTMVELSNGYNQVRAQTISDPSSSVWAAYAENVAHADLMDGMGGGGLIDLSGTLPGGDGVLRYSSGETVTVESKAYFTQQATHYRQESIQLYDSEVARKTPPGEILHKLFDLQGQQPERFRSMMMWPSTADYTSNK
jgi:hypothetical protein